MTPYSFNINVCKNGHCEILNELKLEKGVIKSRIFAMDSCHIGIAGGVIKENGVETISSNLDIANICTQKWIYSDLLPIALSEFGLIETNDYFCLYGGITFDDETDLPQISQLAYCTTLYPTKTTTAFPTVEPTQSPTHMSPSITTSDVNDGQADNMNNEELMWILLAGIFTTCITTFLALILCKIFKKRHEINRTFVPQDTPFTHVQLEMIKELIVLRRNGKKERREKVMR